MSMQIRPPVTFLDANGNPAVDFKVYISAPNTDPKDETKQLSITDSGSGEVVSNPFVVTTDGYPKNANGQRVNPVIQEQTYAILFESVGGGQQYSHPNITGDAFNLSTTSSGMVDMTLNSFQSALSADMTGSSFIFIQSEASAWEDTATGPINSYYAFYTGGQGSPSTGSLDLFYDAGGNEWKIADISQLPKTNADDIAANQAANESAIEANSVAIDAVDTKADEALARPYSYLETTFNAPLSHVTERAANYRLSISGDGVSGNSISSYLAINMGVTAGVATNIYNCYTFENGSTVSVNQSLAASSSSLDIIFGNGGLNVLSITGIGTVVFSVPSGVTIDLTSATSSATMNNYAITLQEMSN